MSSYASSTAAAGTYQRPAVTPWGFLAPEDPVPWRAPEDLMRRMAGGFAAVDDKPAFVAANRLALEAFRGGERDLSAGICQLEIDYAAAKLRDGGDMQTALLGLQPVINLIRLNGYAGDLDLAQEGLAGLEAIADGRPACIAGFPLTGGQPAPVQALARNNCLVETPKILWRRHREEEMLVSSHRLLAKWPRSAVSGPLHAAEAPWLTGVRDPGQIPGLPAPPALRRICALHVLEQVVTPDAGTLAGELFAGRDQALAKPPAAAARDLACLGHALACLGRDTDAVTCLAQAHAAARTDDPALANRIRREWLKLAGPSAVPPELDASRLNGAQLRAAGDLAQARFGSSGSRGRR